MKYLIHLLERKLEIGDFIFIKGKNALVTGGSGHLGSVMLHYKTVLMYI